MTKLIERLLGRPFMAPGDEGAGGGNASAAGNVSGDGAGANSAAGGDGGNAGGAGANGGGQNGGQPNAAAAIAARAGGAFAKPAGQAAVAAAAGDDGVDPATKPGGQERPDFIPEKFWDAKTKAAKTDDIAKAYTALEAAHTKLKGERGWGKAGDKPEDYVSDWKVPADAKLDRIREIDAKTDPAMGAFRKVAHKHKLPVDVASALALDFLTELNPIMEAPATEADIIKDLGEGGAALRDELGTWLAGHFDSKTFSETEIEWAFKNFGKDATGVRVLAKVREMMGEKPIPLSPGKAAGDIPSVEEWYAMGRDPKIATDVAFREKWEALGELVNGSEPAGTSTPGVGMPPPRKVDRRERAPTRV